MVLQSLTTWVRSDTLTIDGGVWIRGINKGVRGKSLALSYYIRGGKVEREIPSKFTLMAITANFFTQTEALKKATHELEALRMESISNENKALDRDSLIAKMAGNHVPQLLETGQTTSPDPYFGPANMPPPTPPAQDKRASVNCKGVWF